MWMFLIYALWFSLVRLSAVKERTQNEASSFVPSKEWQEVRPGQSIPPGLRIRLNLQTGSKEAKLISPEDKDETESHLLMVPEESTLRPSTETKTKHVPTATSFQQTNEQTENISSSKYMFRSYEELKSEFEAIGAQIKTDYELMTSIVRNIKMKPAQESRLLALLEDLAYLLHQVDNGRIFAEESGLIMLSELLDHPSFEVKEASLMAMSAAMQGNTVAKVIALQNGTLERLHNLLKWTAQLPTANTYALKLIQRVVGSLGALLRNFPAAQRYFFGSSISMTQLSPLGFVLLSDAFDFTLSANQTNMSVDTRVRILTLLSDLARERLSAKERSENPQDQTGRKMWMLYSGFPFESGLIDAGWCERLRNSLNTDMHFREDTSSRVNHDRREKLLHCLLYLHPVCERMLFVQPGPAESSVIGDLVRLEEEYASMVSIRPNADQSTHSNEDDVDETQDLANEMLHLIQRLIELHRNSTHEFKHDSAEL